VVGCHRANTATAVFSSVLGSLSGRCFLKTAPVFRTAACSDSHLNAVSFDPVWNTNACRVGDTTRSPPPRTSASPLARFGQHDGPAMRCGLHSSHLLLSGHRRSRASMSSAQPSWPRRYHSTGLTARRVPRAGKSTDLPADKILETPVGFKMLASNQMTFSTPVNHFQDGGFWRNNGGLFAV